MDIMCVLYPQYIYSVDPAASHKTKQKTLMSTQNVYFVISVLGLMDVLLTLSICLAYILL